jgi:flagellar motor switch/type III secretory pathway protein FliN
MADLKLLAVEEVVATCQQGAAEAAAVFSRTFGGEFTLQVKAPEVFAFRSLPEGLRGPGLVVTLQAGSATALLLLPEQSGIIPAWYANPDATGESRLTTLAQELGMILLPEAYMPEEFRAARVARLVEAVARGGLADDSMAVPLELRCSDNRQGVAWLVWPATRPQMVFDQRAGRPAAETVAPARLSGRQQVTAGKKAASVRDLPIFSRSLLRIEVPVVVTLARKRQPLGRIVELGPGSIIHFEKSCEEMLDLEVGGLAVARGEAIKVGDKFGLRVTSIVLPGERFQPLRPTRKAAG